MLLNSLAFNRIKASYSSNTDDAFPNCDYITPGFIVMKSGESKCINNTFFIASNNTNYNVEARYENLHSHKFTEAIKANRPFAVSINDTDDHDVHSKITCLEENKGCKFQIVYVVASEIWNDTEIDGGKTNIYNNSILSYFSTKSNGSQYLHTIEVWDYNHNTKEASISSQRFVYTNIDPSIKKITNTSTHPNITLEVTVFPERSLSNATSFKAETFILDRFRDVANAIKQGKSAKKIVESNVLLEFEKIGDP
ncbi:hypothetical protein TVAG_406640 [Trichomonas vaginalis G3]|uniref:Uncharacterized protein n=1 Tax=Trichomonas vaginalis (strain ATCC PRA-98 / G3) TaxID=412133 RepID=A2EXD8_TRIV3|nr:hypothetical protein TVAGG3_0676880 [Trichomonas vaginalis G3]EAY02687.1 hypothetical protein TVAG_406640 [Trichomonas vaginalis G3]KAI5507596.1 hypothetical protein TVAGG3_0676880 [Trichomonas vaginalis G3]|eukprot:XP_001314910.1 hypothetical protein [Trichomonas vaginalis G3]